VPGLIYAGPIPNGTLFSGVKPFGAPEDYDFDPLAARKAWTWAANHKDDRPGDLEGTVRFGAFSASTKAISEDGTIMGFEFELADDLPFDGPIVIDLVNLRFTRGGKYIPVSPENPRLVVEL